MNSRKTSMGANMIFNVLCSTVNAVFPLIVYPYLLRVLGAENMGKSSFTVSVVEYFVLLANLGIYSYAVREGSVLRNDPVKLGCFLNRIYTIHAASSALSTLLYVITVLAVPGFRAYRTLMFILAPTMLINSMTAEYVNTIREDFRFIAIRTLILKSVYIASLFIFVRSEEDVDIYVLCGVLWAAAQAAANRIRSRGYVPLSFVRDVDARTHLKPVFTMFGMSVTVTLYVNSDITLLGLMCSDYTVGIYSLSAKVYSIIKFIISSVPAVSTPRLSELWGSGRKEEFVSAAGSIHRVMISLVLPAVTGVVLLREKIVYIAGGEEYAASAPSLLILAIAMFFGLSAWFWTECILIPMHREKDVFRATAAAAALNVLLNLLFIPVWQERAAAFTTLLSEGLVYLMCRRSAGDQVRLTGQTADALRAAAGCALIAAFVLTAERSVPGMWLCLAVQIAGSVLLYAVSQYALGNEAAVHIVKSLRERLGREE